MGKLNWRRWDPARDGHRGTPARPRHEEDEEACERERPGRHRETPEVRARLAATEAQLARAAAERAARRAALVDAVQRAKLRKAVEAQGEAP